MYLAAPCNVYFKPRITIGDGTCEVGIPVREDLFHAARAVHGSVYFKAMDDAAFFAASSVIDDMFVVTVSFNVTFHRPVTKGELVCAGKVVQSTKQLVFAEAVVTDSDGRTVARGNGTFVRSSIPLGKDLGYALDAT
jgi:uncharacterized protein (TIGR00369 family)